MESGKAKTAEQKERDRDKRLRKTYGISLAQYNEILAYQDGKCAICGRKATEFTVSLNVDHRHVKIHAQRSQREEKGWLTGCPELSPRLWWGKTKTKAIALAKDGLRPLSVRGLLCPGRHFGCNRLLGRVDKPVWLARALDYLNDPPAKKVLTNTQKCDTMLSEGK